MLTAVRMQENVLIKLLNESVTQGHLTLYTVLSKQRLLGCRELYEEMQVLREMVEVLTLAKERSLCSCYPIFI